MIIVKLSGGLGNQLFQYALGRKISIAKNEKLLFDTSDFIFEYSIRKYALGNFNIKGKPISKFWQQKLVTPNTKINRFAKTFCLLDEKIESKFVIQKDYGSIKRPITYYSGFWQSHKYFQDIRDTLLDDIQISSEKLEYLKTDIQKGNMPIAIHVRRKDYSTDTRYGVLDKSFYLNGITLMNSRFKKTKFIIFSDDIAWCISNFNNIDNVIFLPENIGLTDQEELLLIASCKHHIIANSSFSWWGAWLCKNNDQVVVRPAKPFNDESLLYENYYPENWIALSN